jgi:tRNA(adenine34) deaminase
MKRALWLAIGRLAAGTARRVPGREDTRDATPGSCATPTDVRMMRRALALARRAAAKGEVPVGAVVYRTRDGLVLGEGYNLRESSHSPLAHAEALAVEQACRARGDWRLDDCTLVVTLEPCVMCAGLVVNARVGRLVYGACDPKCGGAGTLYRLTEDPRLNHRVAPVRGVLGERCASLLRGFFAGLRGKRGAEH